MRSLHRFLFLSFLLFLTACGDSQTGSENKESDLSSENVRPEYGAVEGTAASAGKQREEEQQAVESKLKEFGNRLDSLKGEAGKLGEKAKAELKGMIQELEKKMAVAEKRLEEFKSASADAWQEAEARTVAAMEELEESYSQVIARLKRST